MIFSQRGFISILVIVIASILTASAGAGVVLVKQGKLSGFTANVVEVFQGEGEVVERQISQEEQQGNENESIADQGVNEEQEESEIARKEAEEARLEAERALARAQQELHNQQELQRQQEAYQETVRTLVENRQQELQRQQKLQRQQETQSIAEENRQQELRAQQEMAELQQELELEKQARLEQEQQERNENKIVDIPNAPVEVSLPLPVVLFYKEPVGTIEYKITWEAKNANSCDIPDIEIYGASVKGVVDITPLEPTTYTIICRGEGGETSSSLTLVNRYTILTKDNVNVLLEPIIASFAGETYINEYNNEYDTDIFKLTLKFPSGIKFAGVGALNVSLISEFPDNYYINQLRAKGFSEDRDSICLPEEQGSNALCGIYFQVAQTHEYIDYIPAPDGSPVVGPAIKKATPFSLEGYSFPSIGPNESIIIVFNAKLANYNLMKKGENWRLKIRIDKLVINGEYMEMLNLASQPFESTWIPFVK